MSKESFIRGEVLWSEYQNKTIVEMTPWTADFNMTNVHIDTLDKNNRSPKAGDMIARLTDRKDYMWLMAGQDFVDNYTPVVYELEVNDPEDLSKGLPFEITHSYSVSEILKVGLVTLVESSKIRKNANRDMAANHLEKAIEYLSK